MIPAGGSYSAMFKLPLRNPESKQQWSTRRVVAWSDEGDALVLDESRGALRIASEYKGFDGVIESDDPPTVTAVSGAGWFVKFNRENGEEDIYPIVAWIIDEEGDIQPICSDSFGHTMRLKDEEDAHEIVQPVLVISDGA